VGVCLITAATDHLTSGVAHAGNTTSLLYREAVQLCNVGRVVEAVRHKQLSHLQKKDISRKPTKA
jgi:hypothetical protein